MPPIKNYCISVAVVSAVVGLTACASSFSSPVPSSASPPIHNAPEKAAAQSFAVSIDGSSAAKPQIENGSQIDIVVTGASNATSGYADAAGSRTPLTRAADGTWRTTLQYIDEVNPPPAHPVIDVAMRFHAGEQAVHRIPIVELHE